MAGGGRSKPLSARIVTTGRDAAAQKLQYRVKQFPRQARVTKNFGGKNLAGKAFSFEDAKKWIEQLEEEPPAEGDGERGGDGAEKGLPRERMSSDTRPAAANEDEWTGNFSRFPHLQFYGCFGGAEGMLLELREEIQKARVEHLSQRPNKHAAMVLTDLTVEWAERS